MNDLVQQLLKTNQHLLNSMSCDRSVGNSPVVGNGLSVANSLVVANGSSVVPSPLKRPRIDMMASSPQVSAESHVSHAGLVGYMSFLMAYGLDTHVLIPYDNGVILNTSTWCNTFKKIKKYGFVELPGKITIDTLNDRLNYLYGVSLLNVGKPLRDMVDIHAPYSRLMTRSKV